MDGSQGIVIRDTSVARSESDLNGTKHEGFEKNNVAAVNVDKSNMDEIEHEGLEKNNVAAVNVDKSIMDGNSDTVEQGNFDMNGDLEDVNNSDVGVDLEGENRSIDEEGAEAENLRAEIDLLKMQVKDRDVRISSLAAKNRRLLNQYYTCHSEKGKLIITLLIQMNISFCVCRSFECFTSRR